MTYKYLGSEEVHIPSISLTVQPGVVFESPIELTNPDFQLVQEIVSQPIVLDQPVEPVIEQPVITDQVTE